MNLKKQIFFFSTSLLLLNCNIDKKDDVNTKKNIITENLNLIITPDLSNRIKKYPKPLSDIALITNIFDNYYPTLYNYKNRISKQKDALNLLFTNSNIITEYDYNGFFTIDIFKKENQNSSYLKTFDGSETKFKEDSRTLIKNLSNVYDKARINPAGADIVGFFKKLNTIIKKDNTKQVQDYRITTKYRNIIVLFTDGYIEAGIYDSSNCNGNKCYFLTKDIINKFRKDFKSNGGNLSLEEFFQKKQYGIIPVANTNLKDVEILVCELYDRSLDAKTGSQRQIPNDLEILKIFWKDWLKKSGFKKSKLFGKVDSMDEFQKNFITFINEK